MFDISDETATYDAVCCLRSKSMQCYFDLIAGTIALVGLPDSWISNVLSDDDFVQENNYFDYRDIMCRILWRFFHFADVELGIVLLLIRNLSKNLDRKVKQKECKNESKSPCTGTGTILMRF